VFGQSDALDAEHACLLHPPNVRCSLLCGKVGLCIGRQWSCCRRCNGAGAGFQLYSLINDIGWDLRAFVGYAPVLGAKVVAFRGTDSHSW
jgi:hypothetical protein